MQFSRKYVYSSSSSGNSGIFFNKPSLTQQRFKSDCDINCIVDRYGFSGHVPLSPRKAYYGDFSNMPDSLMDVFHGYSKANEYLSQQRSSESKTVSENDVAEDGNAVVGSESSGQSPETA